MFKAKVIFINKIIKYKALVNKTFAVPAIESSIFLSASCLETAGDKLTAITSKEIQRFECIPSVEIRGRSLGAPKRKEEETKNGK